jgi:hypothetical protein
MQQSRTLTFATRRLDRLGVSIIDYNQWFTRTMQPPGRSSENESRQRFQLTTTGMEFLSRRLYLPATLLAVAVALVGFWPTYFGPLLKGRVDTPLLIHVHAVVYVLWLALFVAQVVLVATNRVRLHVQLGRWIMVYGVVLVIAGLMAMAEGFGARLATGDVFRAQRWLFSVLRDLVFFVPFLIAGWTYRRKPEIHKRLMIVATTIPYGPETQVCSCGFSCHVRRCA